MRVTDVFLAFPSLLLALALAAVLPTSLTSLTIAIAVTWWPWYTRLIRGQAASVAGRPYIDSCRALGIPRLAHHPAAHPAQLDHPADRAGVAGRRRGDPHRLGPVFPRASAPRTRPRTGG